MLIKRNDLSDQLLNPKFIFDRTQGGAIEVTEQDGSPSVEGVKEIRVTNGTLTDEGNGIVSIDTGGGGGSSPLTTKGDVYSFSTVDARLGVGANGTVLTADSAETTGLKWATNSAVGAFNITGGVVHEDQTSGAYATDDFVFGSPQLDDDANTDHDRRMFFDKAKGAFRAGRATAAQWDSLDVGTGSVAFGENNIADGAYSTALGWGTTAAGSYSVSTGNAVEATAISSFAFGETYTNNKTKSLSVGKGATASDTTPAGLVRLHADVDQDNTKKSAIELATTTGATTATNLIENRSGTLYFNGSVVGGGGGGDVTKVGTPVNDQLGVWTGDGTIEGVTGLTYDGTNLTASGTITGAITGNAGTVTNGVYTTDFPLNQDTTGNAATVTTITGLAPDTATTQATQPNITTTANLTTVGTIGTGTWQGTAINQTYLVGQSGTNTGDETDVTIKTKLGAASTSHDGYLTQTNWDTFNEKADNPMTTQGDTVYGGASGTETRLGIGTAAQVLTVNAGATAPEWADAGGGSGAFSTASNVTSNTTGTLATDDFVFGSDQLDFDSDTDHNRRMFFDKAKGAFRAGNVISTEWDNANLGSGSFACGEGTVASGTYSTATGNNTTASGGYSLTTGEYLTASANASVSMGSSFENNKKYSLAVGLGTGETDTSPAGLVRLHSDVDQDVSRKAAIELSTTTGATTATNMLENRSGTLYFNGSTVGGTSSGIEIGTAAQDLSVGDLVSFYSPALFAASSTGVGFGLTSGVKEQASIVFGNGVSMSSIKLALSKTGTPTDNLTVRIETDSSGEPSGTLVNANATGTVAAGSLTTSLVDTTVTLGGAFTITNGTKCWVVLGRDGATSDTNYWNRGYSSKGITAAYKSYSTSTWVQGYYNGYVSATGLHASGAIKNIEHITATIKPNVILYVGFATDTYSAGDTVSVQKAGVDTNQSGLVAGSSYTIGTDGNLLLESGTVTTIALALSTTSAMFHEFIDF